MCGKAITLLILTILLRQFHNQFGTEKLVEKFVPLECIITLLKGGDATTRGDERVDSFIYSEGSKKQLKILIIQAI
jgi:hypothetical protein